MALNIQSMNTQHIITHVHKHANLHRDDRFSKTVNTGKKIILQQNKESGIKLISDFFLKKMKTT